jgi:hypothetical protein
MAIKECSEERYDTMLGILPPHLWIGKGFLVGEPHDHRECKIAGHTAPTYAAFFNAFPERVNDSGTPVVIRLVSKRV